jgi:ubiquinone/menaquinone biosynthesis C-methylase UbiE
VQVADKDKTAYYEELGDKFEEYMSDYDVERRLHLMFSALIDGSELGGRRVLEVGSGTGRISRVIVEGGAELTIVDVGPGLVTDVATGLGCDGVAGDALHLPFADETFDLIVSSECIEHTLDPRLAIREMCRVCSPGGAVCLTTPNRLWYLAMRASQKMGLRDYAGIENWLYPRQAAAMMKSHGMTDLTISGCHLWPFQIRFLRPALKRVDGLGKWLYPFMINFGILSRKQS